MSNNNNQEHEINSLNKKFPQLDQIEIAAKNDYDNQTTYDNAFDRKKGFIAGAKWAKWIIEQKLNPDHSQA